MSWLFLKKSEKCHDFFRKNPKNVTTFSEKNPKIPRMLKDICGSWSRNVSEMARQSGVATPRRRWRFSKKRSSDFTTTKNTGRMSLQATFAAAKKLSNPVDQWTSADWFVYDGALLFVVVIVTHLICAVDSSYLRCYFYFLPNVLLTIHLICAVIFIFYQMCY